MEIANKVESKSNPKIYVACLSAYNAGTLHGSWIDANQDAEDIQEEIQEMLSDSPEPVAEEFRIDDYEGFGSFHLAEYEDIETVSALARLLDEFGEMVASTVWGHVSSNADEARRLLEECYQGSWESLEAWAEELLESSGPTGAAPHWCKTCGCRCDLDQVPEHLRPPRGTTSRPDDPRGPLKCLSVPERHFCLRGTLTSNLTLGILNLTATCSPWRLAARCIYSGVGNPLL